MAKNKVVSYCKFVEPESAGSFVGYYGKVKGEYPDLTLTVADCNRKVDMNIQLNDKGLKKIQNIINVLEKLKDAVIEHAS